MFNKSSKNMLWRKWILVLVLLIASHGTCFTVQASSTGWDAAFTTIDQMYDSLTYLESVNKSEKLQIQNLRKQNNDKLKAINEKIKLIDRDKLNRLQSDSDQTEKKYASLLSEYSELGKKASEARKRKDQKSALLYDLKRNRIKASVTNAKQEIKSRKDALAAAKKQTAAKAKLVKDALLPVQSIKKQITAENKVISSRNKDKSAADKQYKTAVKLGDAVSAAAHLNQMIQSLSQIQASQSQIYQWEKSIAQHLKLAEGKLPGS